MLRQLVFASCMWLAAAGISAAVAQRATSFAISDFSTAASEQQLLTLGNTLVSEEGVLYMTYNSSGARGAYFISRVLHSSPVFLHDLSKGTAASFSTSFTFSIDIANQSVEVSGDGLTIILAPDNLLPHTRSAAAAAMGTFDVDLYKGPNASLLHFVAVEYDTFLNLEYNDPDDHHVGLDLSSLTSVAVQTLPPDLVLKSTNSSRRLVTWIDYDAAQGQLDVFLAVAPAEKASATKILSYPGLHISDHTLGTCYVGFTASTGIFTERHSVYEWNFSSTLVSVPVVLPPQPHSSTRRTKNILIISLTVCSVAAIASVSILIVAWKCMRLRAAGLSLKDVDLTTGPRRFTYRELRMATGDFKDMLGSGSSGNVYKGVINTGNAKVEQVAVKRISKASRYREKEFKSEVLTIGKLRHRNLVHLYGWCIDKEELLLVYQFMSSGSLDKLLYDTSEKGFTLNWRARLNVLRAVAAALVYLHVDGEKRIVHRDIKSSNVMLDSDLNARLGDFGLARYFNHDQYCTESAATGVAGTWGYMAPEYAMSGRVSTESDMFSFGILALEIACGQRPFMGAEETLLDYVWRKYEEGNLMHSADSRLNGEFDVDEMGCMLHVGLLCTHPDPKSRLTAVQVLQTLRDVELPELPVSRPTAIYVQVATSRVYRNGILTSPLQVSGFPSTSLENIQLSEPR